jgi:hypothetical protein
MMSLIICFTCQVYWDDKINEDEVGGACNKHVEHEKCIQHFSRKT